MIRPLIVQILIIIIINWLNSSKLTATSINIRKDFLTCFYTNADQLTNKKDDLITSIADCEPDIIAITEVLPKVCVQDITSQIFSIPGYSLHNNFDDSMSNKPRGIIIYTKNYLPTEKIVITDISGKKFFIYEHRNPMEAI